MPQVSASRNQAHRLNHIPLFVFHISKFDTFSKVFFFFQNSFNRNNVPFNSHAHTYQQYSTRTFLTTVILKHEQCPFNSHTHTKNTITHCISPSHCAMWGWGWGGRLQIRYTSCKYKSHPTVTGEFLWITYGTGGVESWQFYMQHSFKMLRTWKDCF